jgi:hypothetical protein
MIKKGLTVFAIWYFLMAGAGRPMRKGPFPNRIACETYRMRVGRFARTSQCVAITKKK